MSIAMVPQAPLIRIPRPMQVLKRPTSAVSRVLKAREAKERYDGEGCLDLQCGNCKSLVYKNVLYARIRDYAVECMSCEAINVV